MVGFRIRIASLAIVALAGLSACNGDKKATAAVDNPPTTSTPAASQASQPAAPAVEAPLYVEDADAQGVMATLKKKYPSLPVADIKRLNLPGKTAMFEFIAGQQVAYTNEDVDFLLVGGEMLTGSGDQAVNLTERSMKVKMANAFKTIPTDGALRYVYGDGSRQLVVFSDPDCPYCQALEFMFESNKDNLNATILVVPYPIDSLHPQAEAKSKYLLCTKDPDRAWHDWMMTAASAVGRNETPSWDAWAAKNPSTPGCARANLVEKVKKYGRTYGFNQTPILMFTNGMPFLGLPDRNELEKAWVYVRTGQVPPQ